MKRLAMSTAALSSSFVALVMLASPASANPTHASTRSAKPWLNQHQSISRRVQELMSQMTLADKIHMLHGVGMSASPYVGYIPAIPKLGIPALKLEDGPAGVADGMTHVTQLPAPISVSSSFDPSIANQYGKVIGAEEKGKGANINLGPTVNIVRNPQWGRAFESFGADPYLTSQMAVSDIKGIQSQGVMAQVKHFDAYNQETNRNTTKDNTIVSQKALHEIYMPAFRAAVKKAHVASIMSAYSMVNGSFSSANKYLLTDVLRKQWNFNGFVTSDWFAAHSTVKSAKAGLDMEMPNPTYFGQSLETAVKNGQVSISLINNKVRSILREMFRFGLFNRPSTGSPSANVSTPQHKQVALKAAESGTVLLKNQNNVLPLNSRRLKSIAVIGYDASTDLMTGGGGSAHVLADKGTVVTPLTGIRNAAKTSNTRVTYAQGLPSPGSLPAIPSKYLSKPYKAGSSYEATLTAPTTGDYVLAVSDKNTRYTPTTLSVDGKILTRIASTPGDTVASKSIHLQAGHTYQIKIQGPSTGFSWSDGAMTASSIAKAVEQARQSNVAVVFASSPTSEAMDHPNLSLGGGENKLVSAVAKANPHTVVVLNTGNPVTMPWQSEVQGIIEAWYPGQTDGKAIASVLFGKVDPSGHLPMTFPTSLSGTPTASTSLFPGVNGKVHYANGVNVGYRWYDKNNVKVLYPFGYGLSYTSFKYSDLRIAPGHPEDPLLDGGRHGNVRVTLNVTNTGLETGSAVPQLYIGDPQSANEPPKQLKGFQKVTLKQGQTKRVTFMLRPQAFSIWDSQANKWTIQSGTYQIMIGKSSANIKLHGRVQIFGPRGIER
ncbi:glycoside hydrolase family 3 protein [Alicyclobacillus sp. SO9]|uniref:beta-glucosidase n=1 Tax=Alicyclobacillus sp. SO9 TaxID=2665646 RepID=UPI0018E7DD7C|nr:glycoside hydrolase family 3 C-terminal domain-containing protein [Alicyclobacillus sp. SO9]QQE78223.1 glycoside hydrolase family 3 C-terminal domain-containing protein [Alicyclobacillus sp. SO9]